MELKHTETRRKRVVVYTTDTLGAKMAGPGIRALRFAQALHEVADVRLVSEVFAELPGCDFLVEQAGGDRLLDHVEWADVFIFQSAVLTMLPELKNSSTIMVADLYDPFLLEQLQQGFFLGTEPRLSDTEFTIQVVNDMVEFSDFMICASEKQRDLWLGQMSSRGRINALTYQADPSLRSLISVVPFGVDNDAPHQNRHAIKGVVPGISITDKVLIWGGGIYDWFDPLTLIRAVGELAAHRDDVKLFFLSSQLANPDTGVMRMVIDAQNLADELGLLGTSVFFNENWVVHSERADYLLDADIGVSTHRDHLETAFSFRTRLLDYLWAGLPIINTAGDAFESLITSRDIGAVVRPGDVEGLAKAIEALLSDPVRMVQTAGRSRELAATLTWDHATRALVDFCLDPHVAADDPRFVHHAKPRLEAERNYPLEVSLLKNEIAELTSSTSWRITGPVRRVWSGLSRWRQR